MADTAKTPDAGALALTGYAPTVTATACTATEADISDISTIGGGLRVVPPALKIATPLYSEDYVNQNNNILRLFFNRLTTLANLQTDTINDILDLFDAILRPTINYQSGTTYTLTADDERSVIICTNSSAVTVYVPQITTLCLPIGYITHIYQGGVGTVTIAPEGALPIINYPTSASPRTQYSPLSLIKVAADTWHIFGDAAT